MLKIIGVFIFAQLLTATSFAGNDTVYFTAQNAVYKEQKILVSKIFAESRYVPQAQNEEFSPVSLTVVGETEGGMKVNESLAGIGYQVEGEKAYSYSFVGRYGSSLYAFYSLHDFRNSKPFAHIAEVKEDGSVEFVDGYDYTVRFVEYNPTLIDKIMSWVISMGGRVTSADDWVELKVIEKK